MYKKKIHKTKLFIFFNNNKINNMEPIIVGTSQQYKLGLVDTANQLVDATFTEPTFAFNNEGIVNVTFNPDPSLFTLNAQVIGTVNVTVNTNATFLGVTQPKYTSFDINVIAAVPETTLIVKEWD